LLTENHTNEPIPTFENLGTVNRLKATNIFKDGEPEDIK
jgi:hypothetical protein